MSWWSVRMPRSTIRWPSSNTATLISLAIRMQAVLVRSAPWHEASRGRRAGEERCALGGIVEAACELCGQCLALGDVLVQDPDRVA